MLLNDVLDEVIELLQHPEFKNFGDLKKHLYQQQKYTDPEEREIRSQLYKGMKQSPEMIKNQHKHRKQSKESIAKAAKSRSDWYKKHPENYAKFMEAMRRRDAKRKQYKPDENKKKKKTTSNSTVQ